MNDNSSFNLGEIVEVLMGRDSGKFGIVVECVDERFVMIADGDKRKFDNTKRKNVRHLRSTGFLSREVIDSLNESNRVSNAKIRFVLQDYISNHIIMDNRKGE